ncbi:YRB2 Ran-specific GTPase-activating protein 2 [Candida maltosa Xu316]
MPDESPVKRKIESEDTPAVSLKRTKSIGHDDLKSSIVKEVSKIFEDRIEKLEERVNKLEEANPKEESNDDIKRPERKVLNKEPPSLPPRKATFGTNSFSFSPGKVTPLNSFTESGTVPSSPKPVFGATTSFGNMDKISASSPETKIEFKSPSATITKTTTTTTTTTTPTFGSAFGSNSRFGNAFQESLKKKSFLDEEKTKDNNSNITDKDSSNGNTPAPQSFQQVDLAPVEQTTGEEDEISHFNCTAKLFELDFSKINEGWKERGVGPLHLNQSKADERKVRLVMRSQGLLRVILNYKINSDTDILKGLEASLTPGKYFRLNSVNTDKGTPVQYLLKFGNENLRNELIEKIESLKEKIKE